MPQPLSGTGQPLPFPQALYPVSLANSPFTAPCNKIVLQAAGTLVVPAGRWIVAGGVVSVLQYVNPVSGVWENLVQPGASWAMEIWSDGNNFRVANLSGAASGATVTAAGTGYTSAPTVTPSAGNSSWTAILGGRLNAFTVVTAGSGYTMPPRVFVSAPPSPGVQGTAYATLSGATVGSITVVDHGAGYLTAPKIVVLADPNDPSTTIVDATATVSLTGSGTVTAVLLNDFGQMEATAPTLTLSGGGGTGATATVLPSPWVAEANDTILMQPAP